MYKTLSTVNNVDNADIILLHGMSVIPRNAVKQQFSFHIQFHLDVAEKEDRMCVCVCVYI